MTGDKRAHDAIHDHQVGYFARENGLSPDLVWELILKHGNSRKAVIEAAQVLKGTPNLQTKTAAAQTRTLEQCQSSPRRSPPG
jgi:hypothetical protein